MLFAVLKEAQIESLPNTGHRHHHTPQLVKPNSKHMFTSHILEVKKVKAGNEFGRNWCVKLAEGRLPEKIITFTECVSLWSRN